MKHTLLLSLFLCLSTWAFGQKELASARTDLRVFPNPAAEYFEVEAKAKIRSITLINMVGRQVKRYEYISEQRYYIGDLPRGMYLVQFMDDREKILTTQRLNKR